MEYHLTMDRKVVDIDKFLPFKTKKDIDTFFDQNDGLMNEKKAAFKERLYAAGDTSSTTNFINGIVFAVFDAPLFGNYKWPYKR